MSTQQDFKNWEGRKIVFNYHDDETHERCHLREGDVQLAVDHLVRISGKWYKCAGIWVEAVLPVGASNAIEN